MSLTLALLAAATPIALPPRETANARAVAIVDEAARKRGNRSHVLVLGTAHLSHLPKSFDTTRLKPLIDRLAAWHPQKITIEALSGAQCDYLRQHSFAYPETADVYCYDPAPARKALSITGPEAEKAVLTLLSHKDHTPLERRRMIGLFLAMGDPNSALLQWERLPASEQHSDAALPAQLVAYLEKAANFRDENVSIAVALAKRLGLDRIYAVDDHTGDRAGAITDEKTYGEQLSAIWNSGKLLKRRIATENAWQAKTLAGGSVIAWYRYLNAPQQARLAMETDFAAAAGSTTYPETGRAYLAYWETRNLRIAANIREVAGPGARVLSIIGASHKAYLERYLGMTSDLVIDDVEKLLAD